MQSSLRGLHEDVVREMERILGRPLTPREIGLVQLAEAARQRVSQELEAQEAA